MQSKVEIIKENYTVEQVLKGYKSSITIRATRNGFSVTDCPFCGSSDKLWINAELQICNCFKCGDQAMDVINLWAKLYHASNNGAIKAMFSELQHQGGKNE